MTTGANGASRAVSLSLWHTTRHGIVCSERRGGRMNPGHKDRDGLQAVGGSTSLAMASARELLPARGRALSWAQDR